MSGGNPLENELNTYRTIQKEIGKVQQQISTAGTQILENEMVLKELDILEDDASVYKLIGPVLVKQELMEVKNNVTKRVEFIKNDIARLEGNVKKFTQQSDTVKENIAQLQKAKAAQ
mmetsp:Transcript_62155/g.122837  ORF Transcript_62155/g.122837 Transcript_62155/m.122837 type:complete len:117 (-) Transcript_62155:306-656(-)|eukprot:CAMPEP_0174716390 /NCGR_PEP_ID=MMETSP1094-20130205/23982_1 /TAXON_ID=156173 /ORGANISM="Chrysochromulina brevifilum, Strain UTEX LB 985" /LENGTH=116 /DNA_ID=CAMNT_0015916133 /DNA_START=107 /DNA_END=457 /DNA_ORIENTATION=+